MNIKQGKDHLNWLRGSLFQSRKIIYGFSFISITLLMHGCSASQPNSVETDIDSNVSKSAVENALASEDEHVCGSVSTFFTPPETKRLYLASISNIIGKDANRNFGGFSRQNRSIKLTPGDYIVYLDEAISDPSFKRRYKGLRKPKPLLVKVEPNTTYYLAAKFNYRKANKQRSGEYWDPVVWKKSENRECKMKM